MYLFSDILIRGWNRSVGVFECCLSIDKKENRSLAVFCSLFLSSSHSLNYFILDTHILQSLHISAQDLKNLFLIKQGDGWKTFLWVLVIPSLLDQWSPKWGVQGNTLGCDQAVNKLKKKKYFIFFYFLFLCMFYNVHNISVR